MLIVGTTIRETEVSLAKTKQNMLPWSLVDAVKIENLYQTDKDYRMVYRYFFRNPGSKSQGQMAGGGVVGGHLKKMGFLPMTASMAVLAGASLLGGAPAKKEDLPYGAYPYPPPPPAYMYDYLEYQKKKKQKAKKKKELQKRKLRYQRLHSGLEYVVELELDLFKGKEATAKELYQADCEYRKRLVESEYARLFGKTKKEKDLKIDYSLFTRKLDGTRRRRDKNGNTLSASKTKSRHETMAPYAYVKTLPRELGF
jgi:hypothetical protein